jgi:transcriptional regulator with XRE-family HTH domain
LELGERLREVRRARGLTLHDVQNRTGRHFSTIARYERGERRPSVAFLRELAEIYELSVSELLGERAPRQGGRAERTDLQLLLAIARRMTPAAVADLTGFLGQCLGARADGG